MIRISEYDVGGIMSKVVIIVISTFFLQLAFAQQVKSPISTKDCESYCGVNQVVCYYQESGVPSCNTDWGNDVPACGCKIIPPASAAASCQSLCNNGPVTTGLFCLCNPPSKAAKK